MPISLSVFMNWPSLHNAKDISINDLVLSRYKKDLLRELWRQWKYRYEQPYYAEESEYKRYDDIYRERKKTLASLIKKFHLSVKNDDNQELSNLISMIFQWDTDPFFFSHIKRKFLFERLFKFWNSREKVYDIYDDICDTTNDWDLFLRSVAPWLKGRRFKGEINVYRNWFGVDVYCTNKSDFAKVAAEWNKSWEKENIDTLWITDSHYIRPRAIKQFVRVYNWHRSTKTSSIYTHETQHLINRVFMPSIISPYEKWQDEIIAYLKNGTSKARILQLLLDKTDVYNFFLDAHNKPLHPKTYEKDHGKYFRDILKYVDIAFILKQNNIENYINLLIITPIHDWPKLKKNLLW